MIDRSIDSELIMSGSLLSDHLTPNELSTLSPKNQALLRSVVITTALTADVQDPTVLESDDPAPLVGFECAYCASSPLVKVPTRLSNHLIRVFPISLDAMGASLQLLRDQHFVDEDQRCVLLPFAEEKIFDTPDPHQQASTASVRELQTLSETAAQRIGIRNKVPGEKVGIIFKTCSTTSEPSSSSSPLSKDNSQDMQHLETFAKKKMDSIQGLLNLDNSASAASKPKKTSVYPLNSQLVHHENRQVEISAASSSGNSEEEVRNSERNSALSARQQPTVFPSCRGSNVFSVGRDGGVPAFIPDGPGWSCSACCHIPFHLRAVGSYHPRAPSLDLQMQHLQICTGLLRQVFPTSNSFLYQQQQINNNLMPPPPSLHPALKLARHPSTASPAMFSSEQIPSASSQESENDGALVFVEDRLLLTDYFYFINQQLRICKFSKDDRTKTRGGKRKFIELGFGGIACRHCHGKSDARKFFWRNVDLLANSFSEICNHVQNCTYCPEEVKVAIVERKSRHAEQMAKLPRGWQKVFFRRMWRRIHQDSEIVVEGSPSPPVVAAASTAADMETSEQYGIHNNLSAETMPNKTSEVSMGEENSKIFNSVSSSAIVAPSCSPGACMLAIPEDKQWLSDTDCFIRSCLEVFVANEDDVKEQNFSGGGKKGTVEVGQVGIRCIYCASSRQQGGTPLRKKAIIYPFSINDIYESVREIQKVHFAKCPNTPDEARSKLINLKTQSSLSSIVRRYYVIAAKALELELHDTENGIRARKQVGTADDQGGQPILPHQSSRQKITP